MSLTDEIWNDAINEKLQNMRQEKGKKRRGVILTLRDIVGA